MNSVLPGSEWCARFNAWLSIAGKRAPTANPFSSRTNKTPERVSDQGFWNLILTMTYSHMGKPHTTIGDTSFHY